MKAILILLAVLLMSDCPVVTVTKPATACIGETLTFTANITGGTAPFHYLWNGCILGDSIDLDSSVVHSVVIPSAEIYTVTVSVVDANGCVVGSGPTQITTKDCN